MPRARACLPGQYPETEKHPNFGTVETFAQSSSPRLFALVE
jgi:hypothetical protein